MVSEKNSDSCSTCSVIDGWESIFSNLISSCRCKINDNLCCSEKIGSLVNRINELITTPNIDKEFETEFFHKKVDGVSRLFYHICTQNSRKNYSKSVNGDWVVKGF